ncbi:3-deoxy-manno-octulosonate cytidylyltransferase [bacterium]|jgi:3-deoxy-manno-octulosonate cytidylyltransferase (CMP-KDO synthetase)|nr:3-deoxy-manno-octulosonate cytidylyltransferase [bacterium]
MRVVAVIPARYGSTRLPAKPLADICGKPMIQWVYEKARQSKLCERVCVATDDERVERAVKAFGGEAVMTSAEIQSGTDRMAAVAGLISGDVFVNVQGDEPLIDGRAIDLAIRPVLEGRYELASLRVPLRSVEDLQSKNVVKVIVDDADRALYFSRYPIPYSRLEPADARPPFLCSQHVGIYVYRREALFRMSALPVTALERAESLEQLRAMKAGIAIGVFAADFESVGVDTAEDLEKVRKILGGKNHG